MNIPPAAACPLIAIPRIALGFGTPEAILLALGALLATTFFAVLRSALLHSVPARVMERARSESERARLAPLLARAESLATSASVLEIGFQILFVVLVFALFGEDSSGSTPLAYTLLVSVPILVFGSEVLPAALRGEPTDALLRSTLPLFALLQTPLAVLILGFDALKRGTMRLFRIPEPPRTARQIVEDIRDVVEDSDRDEGLRESEREIIENVVEFYDVDVAEVMTPRTELRAVDVEADAGELIRLIADCGHSRVPIYEASLDVIIGTVYARDVMQLVATDSVDGARVRDLLRPVTFVPETKLVSELLAEFRIHRQKMAVVIDEYGGTAGIVTMGDILEEIVGDIPEEHGKDPEPVVELPDGTFEVLGSTHVSDVNEEIDLDLPEEEDFETLAGFVLAELGRFPKEGESFRNCGADFTVLAASDRRVLSVRVAPLRPRKRRG